MAAITVATEEDIEVPAMDSQFTLVMEEEAITDRLRDMDMVPTVIMVITAMALITTNTRATKRNLILPVIGARVKSANVNRMRGSVRVNERLSCHPVPGKRK